MRKDCSFEEKDRSRIRDNQKINIYIPSKRMRNLLESWLQQ